VGIQDSGGKHGKILISWNDFIITIKKQFYPLAYKQKATMEWKILDKLKDRMYKALLRNLGEEI
jgi:hypothetical protein